MALATRSKIRRMFAGTFTENAEFIPQHVPMPRRYRCSCNANGFVAGQVIKHMTFCPFHPHNIDVFLGEESILVQAAVAFFVIALCVLASFAFIMSIASL